MLSNRTHSAKLLLRSLSTSRILQTKPRLIPSISNTLTRASSFHTTHYRLSSSSSQTSPEAHRRAILSTLDKWVEQTRLSALSPPPPQSQGWPTPWITKELADEYFPPLFNRGWKIEFIEDRANLPKRRTAFMHRTITFRRYSSALKFMDHLRRLSRTEKHHASLVTIKSAGYKTHVSLFLQTHSAVPPSWLATTDTVETGGEEHDDITSAAVHEEVQQDTLAGITSRDVRYAVLLEEALQCDPLDAEIVNLEGEREVFKWEEFVGQCKEYNVVEKEAGKVGEIDTEKVEKGWRV
ncbi:hypothetical protein BDQ17DRAFT_1421095 [Cyathus striatus]|nr:hypothetical protein BDQ17DRAFT_1421095 [Cyathus striatus]